MELTFQQQTTAFAFSFLVGIGISFIYTILAMIRAIFAPSKTTLIIMDCVFMCLSAVITFLYSVAVTIGIVRWYVVFGEFVSCLAFYFLIGRYLKKSSKFIFDAIKHFLSFIFMPIFNLLCRLLVRLKSFVGAVWGKRKKKTQKSGIFSKFRLQCHKKMLYNTSRRSAQKR